MEILKENNLNFTIIEYLKKPPSINELILISKALEIEPYNFIRKSEKIYSELDIQQYKNDSKKLIHLIVKYPLLLERPIIIKDNKGVIGRPPENILSLI